MTPHETEADISPDGIARAGELAAHTMNFLTVATDIARLSVTVAATYLLAELLAVMEVEAGISPAAAFRAAELLIAPRVAALRDAIAEAEEDCPVCKADEDDAEDPPPDAARYH